MCFFLFHVEKAFRFPFPIIFSSLNRIFGCYVIISLFLCVALFFPPSFSPLVEPVLLGYPIYVPVPRSFCLSSLRLHLLASVHANASSIILMSSRFSSLTECPYIPISFFHFFISSYHRPHTTSFLPSPPFLVTKTPSTPLTLACSFLRRCLTPHRT